MAVREMVGAGVRVTVAAVGRAVLTAVVVMAVVAAAAPWGFHDAGSTAEVSPQVVLVSTTDDGACGDEPCPPLTPEDEVAGDGPCGGDQPCAPLSQAAAEDNACGDQPCAPLVPEDEVAGDGPCGDQPCAPLVPEGEVAGDGPCGDQPCAPLSQDSPGEASADGDQPGQREPGEEDAATDSQADDGSIDPQTAELLATSRGLQNGQVDQATSDRGPGGAATAVAGAGALALLMLLWFVRRRKTPEGVEPLD